MERECGDLPFGEYLNLPMTYSFPKRLFLGAKTPPKNIGFGKFLGMWAFKIIFGRFWGSFWEKFGKTSEVKK